MVKRVERTPHTHATETTQVQKTSKHLKDLKGQVNKFMSKEGFDLLGAGKPHVFSDRPPSKDAKRVAQAVKHHW